MTLCRLLKAAVFLVSAATPACLAGGATVRQIVAENVRFRDVYGFTFKYHMMCNLYFVDAFGVASGDPDYSVACDFGADGSVNMADLLPVDHFGK